MKKIFCLLPLFLLLFGFSLNAAEMSLEKTETGYEVKIGGEPFAGYVTDFKGTPIIWPIIGPNGKKMTRDYPMSEDNAEEKKDHPHHRSLWFDHGEVGGADFWAIRGNNIRHDKFAKAECDGQTVVLETENSWVKKDGEIPCTDKRTITFRETPLGRIIDFDVTVTGVADETLFGDTKEGSFGIRVPTTMDVVGPRVKDENHGGKITNAQGITDGEAWAKRSEWVDFSGPVEGEWAGITVFNHPSSFRFPTFWHVRTYGLFAANPFGEHDFLGKPEKTGEYVLKKGDSFTLRYRVLFHKGDADSLDLKKAFEDYKK